MVIDVCSTTKSIVNRIGKSTHVTSFFNDKKYCSSSIPSTSFKARIV